MLLLAMAGSAMSPSRPALSSRIALVEDHARLADLVTRGLATAGIAVDVYPGLEAAWHGVRAQAYAGVVIDRGLPDGDGLELVRRLRRAGDQVPCLVLTSRDALHDRVDGLDAGADDYLVKPFAMDELAARMRALMRRPAQLRSLQPGWGGVVVEPGLGRMRVADSAVSLSAAELQIILCLVRAEGATVRKAELEAAAWGIGDAVTPNALDVAIHRLRRKLAAIDAAVGVVNVRTLGFALREPGDVG